MKKLLTLLLMITFLIVGCGNQNTEDEDIIGGAYEPTTINLESDFTKDESSAAIITEDDALNAIKNYCYENYPNLKEMEDSGEYEIYWNIESSDDEQIVVAFRSYTAAIVRFYINTSNGETYITEYVDGITPEEEQTGETFNIKDYNKTGE